MGTEEIETRIQQEKDSFNRQLNKLQSDICKLKQQHQRSMEYLNKQKEQIKQKTESKFSEQLKKFEDVLDKACGKVGY